MHRADRAASKNEQSKYWCFTLNNYTEQEYNYIIGLPLEYIVVGREVGLEKTPHLQGYLVTKQRKRFNQIKEMVPRAHIERALGTPEENKKYCMKEGDYVEIGTLPITKGEATKRKWEEIRDHAKNGDFDKIEPEILVKHYNNLKKIKYDNQVFMLEPIPGLINEWIYGPTGSGKSKAAREENPIFYNKSCNKWWDGYNNEPVVIIDDFDTSHHVLGHHLKIWGDHYSFNAEVKGGALHIRPQKIIITSNYHPAEIFKDKNILDPILRRYQIIHKA